VLTDLVAFIATAIAGVVILLTGFDRADGIASLFVAAVMLRAAWGLLRDSGRIFLEAAPRGVDVDAIGRAMVAQPGVSEVHDLHVWEVTQASSPCPPTSRSAATTTATPPARIETPAPRPLRRSSTRPCRSTTKAESSCKSKPKALRDL
jgi:cobalt-zinc-cadmium efflux system protein